MHLKLALLAMWTVAAICIRIMKKISPDTKWYPAYVLGICALVTGYLLITDAIG